MVGRIIGAMLFLSIVVPIQAGQELAQQKKAAQQKAASRLGSYSPLTGSSSPLRRFSLPSGWIPVQQQKPKALSNDKLSVTGNAIIRAQTRLAATAPACVCSPYEDLQALTTVPVRDFSATTALDRESCIYGCNNFIKAETRNLLKESIAIDEQRQKLLMPIYHMISKCLPDSPNLDEWSIGHSRKSDVLDQKSSLDANAVKVQDESGYTHQIDFNVPESGIVYQIQAGYGPSRELLLVCYGTHKDGTELVMSCIKEEKGQQLLLGRASINDQEVTDSLMIQQYDERINEFFNLSEPTDEEIAAHVAKQQVQADAVDSRPPTAADLPQPESSPATPTNAGISSSSNPVSPLRLEAAASAGSSPVCTPAQDTSDQDDSDEPELASNHADSAEEQTGSACPSVETVPSEQSDYCDEEAEAMRKNMFA